MWNLDCVFILTHEEEDKKKGLDKKIKIKRLLIARNYRQLRTEC